MLTRITLTKQNRTKSSRPSRKSCANASKAIELHEQCKQTKEVQRFIFSLSLSVFLFSKSSYSVQMLFFKATNEGNVVGENERERERESERE